MARAPAAILLTALAVAAAPSANSARATTWRVPAEPGALSAATARAQAGDTLALAPGVHRGGATIPVRLTILGEPGTIVDGGGEGSVITIRAAGVVVENITVRGSGPQVTTIDSGVRLAGVSGVRLRRVRMEDVLYGVVAERADSLRLESCDLRGRASPHEGVQLSMEASQGNGIHLWYCADAVVRDCRVARFMDGLYLSFAHRSSIEECLFWENGRYGLHTMYNQRNRLLRNRFTRNIAGCALMFSNHLQVEGNDFSNNRGPRTYGLLLRDCSDGSFSHNRLVDDTVALFMDGSNRNRFHENLFQDNGWGLILFSSCDGNEFARNNFWNNDYSVALDMKRSDNRFDDGTAGNYWSDNSAYDLDGDGVSDVPFSPVTAFAFLSKQFPDLAIFGKSPAATALTVAERTIPALRPSEIVDRFPLVTPTRLAPSSPVPDPPRGSPTGGRAAAAAGFGILAVAGLAGLAGAARSR